MKNTSLISAKILLLIEVILQIVYGQTGIKKAFALPEQLPTVVTMIAQRQEVSQILIFPAVVEAKIHATILAETDGVVKKVHVSLGRKVSANERLMTIQQIDPIFQFAAVKAFTPVTGVVSELNVTEGALVMKGQKLASVTDPKKLRILVEIPGKNLHLVQLGMKGQLVISGISLPLNLKLIGLTPNVDMATGTATGELELDGKKTEAFSGLSPGVMGKIVFKVDSHLGFLVPEDIVIQNQEKNFLRVVENGKAKKIPVLLGDRIKGQIEIKEGLKEGMKIVLRSNSFVAEGESVVEMDVNTDINTDVNKADKKD